MELEPRVTALEKDMAVVKSEQVNLRSNCATKEDLLNTKLELIEEMHKVHAHIETSIWRMFGFNVGMNTLVVTAVYFMISSAH
jgi:hypothetical protein